MAARCSSSMTGVLAAIGRRWEPRAVLASDFDRSELLDVLEANTVRIGVGFDEHVTATDTGARCAHQLARRSRRGDGPGRHWCRRSVAMALAQGLAADVRLGGLVALADLALDADQAMLHDAGDVVPGIQELVEIHRDAVPARRRCGRSRTPSRTATTTWCSDCADIAIGSRFVLARSMPRSTVCAALTRRSSPTSATTSREKAECGSIDVEERNLMARSTTAAADVVVVVGQREHEASIDSFA